MIEKAFNNLEDYIVYNFNYIPVSQLDKDVDFGKFYSIYTPNELMTEYKILLDYKIGMISRETKNHLIDTATKYKDVRREVYRCRYINNTKFFNAYSDEYAELLNNYNLPISLNLSDMVSLYSNYTVNADNSVIGLDKEFKKLCGIINNWFNNKKLKELMPFKELGKYEDYTPSLFLTVYKIYLMALENKIDGVKAQYLFNVCDEINKINNSNTKDSASMKTIHNACLDELSRFGLTDKFDLNTIVNIYGSIDTKQKVK